VIVLGVDDVINTAGHRLSTGAMEEILSANPNVAGDEISRNFLTKLECAVVGVNDQLKGEVPVGFIVLKSGTKKSGEEVAEECVKVECKRLHNNKLGYSR
jgi:propionyl-CoA synthetase